MTEQELRRKALASMDNCYLEIGTIYKDIVQKQAIPPALREKIYDQLILLKDEEGKPMLGIVSNDQSAPIVEEDNPFVRLDEQAKMLASGFRRMVIVEE